MLEVLDKLDLNKLDYTGVVSCIVISLVTVQEMTTFSRIKILAQIDGIACISTEKISKIS